MPRKGLGDEPLGAVGGVAITVPERFQEGMRVHLKAIRGVTSAKAAKDLPYKFLCPPMDSISVVFGGEHGDYMTIESGQFSMPAGRALRQVSFSTLVVDYQAPFTVNHGPFLPKMHTRGLQRLTESTEPFMLTAFHAPGREIEFQFPVTLRSFEATERAGEIDARYFDVSFVEWRETTVRKDVRSKFPKRVKITKDTTLRQLARRYYGRPSLAKTIAKRNGLRSLGADTPIVKAKGFKEGDQITVPKPPGKRQHLAFATVPPASDAMQGDEN